MKLTPDQLRALAREATRYSMSGRGVVPSLRARRLVDEQGGKHWLALMGLGLVDGGTTITEAGRAHLDKLLAVEVAPPEVTLKDLKAFPGVAVVFADDQFVSVIGDDRRGCVGLNTAEGRAKVLEWLKTGNLKPVNFVYRPKVDEEADLLRKLRAHQDVRNVEVCRFADHVEYRISSKPYGRSTCLTLEALRNYLESLS